MEEWCPVLTRERPSGTRGSNLRGPPGGSRNDLDLNNEGFGDYDVLDDRASVRPVNATPRSSRRLHPVAPRRPLTLLSDWGTEETDPVSPDKDPDSDRDIGWARLWNSFTLGGNKTRRSNHFTPIIVVDMTFRLP